MYQTQLLKIRIRPGKTGQVEEFLRTLMDRKDESIEALRREGMVVESLFLERRDEADYLYYYVKAKDLMEATQVNLRATDPLTLEIRQFVSETWGDVSSPEPLLDIDLIPDDALQAAPAESASKARARRPDPIGKSGKSSKPAKSTEAAKATKATKATKSTKSTKATKATKAKSTATGAQGVVPPHALAGG